MKYCLVTGAAGGLGKSLTMGLVKKDIQFMELI